MTATQAPTPGPLSADDVKLLVKGDCIRGPNGKIYRLEEWGDGGFLTFIDEPHDGYLATLCAFIGRPDESGWMPWSGGENPVPGRMVEVRWTNSLVEQYYSDIVSWRKGGVMVEAFRLAPTAPVEASGSEEIDLYDDKVQEGISWTMRQWGEALGLTTWTQGDGSESVEGDVGAEIHTILVDAGLRDAETNEMAALRPQPSGETREAVRLALEDADALERVSEEADDNQWQDWAATMRQAASRIRRLALLSARPLALGGQQGEGHADALEPLRRSISDLKTHIQAVQTAKKEGGPGNTITDCINALPDIVRALEAAEFEVEAAFEEYEDTTPARAEAQDEGAAGEWPEVTDQWAETYCDLTGKNPDGAQVSFIGDGVITTTFRDMAKRQIETMLCAAPKAAVRAIFANPSPTPAADVQSLEAERDAWKLRGDQHWETLRSIREFAREGDCERIIKWVNDAGSGYTESAEQTLGQMTDRALKAEAALASTPAADADRVRELETVADLADELINRGGLINRGMDRGLVVVEKADRSDPHYRLCLALEALKSTAAKEGGAL